MRYSGDSPAYRMKIHEYQAKSLLARYGVPVPRGHVAQTVDEAEAAAKEIGGSVVVKAQIHAGGRGKGGGVKVAKNAEEAAEIAGKILVFRTAPYPDPPYSHAFLDNFTLTDYEWRSPGEWARQNPEHRGAIHCAPQEPPRPEGERSCSPSGNS